MQRTSSPESLEGIADAFHPRIEAWRGLAALAIAAFHSWQSPWIDATGRTRSFISPAADASHLEKLVGQILKTIGNGQGAVTVFFVLSGFVLTASLSRGPQGFPAGLARFVIARVFRIYPALFAAVALFGIWFAVTGKHISAPEAYQPLSLLRNALLLNVIVDGVTWTLQIEMIAVPLIYVVYCAWRRWGLGVLLAAFAILAALSFWGAWNGLIGGVNQFGQLHAFVAGILAFALAPGLAKRCSPRIGAVIFAVAMVLLVSCRWTIDPVYSPRSALAEAIFAAVAVALLTTSRAGPLGRVLDLGLLRFFGRISYSFYLLHPLTLTIIWKMPQFLGSTLAAGVPAGVVIVLLFVLSSGVTVPLALVTYRWVEIPGIAMGRRIRERLSEPARAVAMP